MLPPYPKMAPHFQGVEKEGLYEGESTFQRIEW